MFNPADREQQQFLETLFLDEAQHVFVLLDPMLADPEEILRLDQSKCERFIVPLVRSDIPEDRYPFLVRLHPRAVEVIYNSLELAFAEQTELGYELGSGFSVGGWLTSHAEPEVLVRHLSAAMRQMAPGSSATKYVRWADRRVFEWMWQGLDSDERAKLLGPIVSWWSLNRCGKLIEHSVDVQTYRGFPMVRFSMQSALWELAAQCEPIQAILRGWVQFARNLPLDYLAKATQALHSVRSLGVMELSDIVLVSAYVLQIHPRLCDHPRMRELVRKSQEQSLPLMDTLAEVPDPEGWDSMRNDLSGAYEANPDVYRSSKHG